MLAEKLTPKELVLKHIFDKNHVVTEEELKNVKVGFSPAKTVEAEKEEELQLSETFARQ
jgi:phosphoribosyl 1,2-cyclic phosphodiesterase